MSLCGRAKGFNIAVDGNPDVDIPTKHSFVSLYYVLVS